MKAVYNIVYMIVYTVHVYIPLYSRVMNDSVVLYTPTEVTSKRNTCLSVLIYMSAFMYEYLSTQHSIVYTCIHTVYELIY